MVTRSNKNGIDVECQIYPDFLRLDYKANNTNFQCLEVKGEDNVRNFLINIQEVLENSNKLLSNPKLWIAYHKEKKTGK